MTATAVTSVRVDARGQTDIGLRRKVNEDHFVIMTLLKAARSGRPVCRSPEYSRGSAGRRDDSIVADDVGGSRRRPRDRRRSPPL